MAVKDHCGRWAHRWLIGPIDNGVIDASVWTSSGGRRSTEGSDLQLAENCNDGYRSHGDSYGGSSAEGDLPTAALSTSQAADGGASLVVDVEEGDEREGRRG